MGTQESLCENILKVMSKQIFIFVSAIIIYTQYKAPDTTEEKLTLNCRMVGHSETTAPKVN